MMSFFDRIVSLDDAMIVRPASEEDIREANSELLNLNLPPIPSDYKDFLKHCNGFAFNGVELFGTDIVTDPETGFQLIDIVSYTEQQLEYYDEELLYFGCVDDDIYTYNPRSQKYETRDISGFEVYDEFESFGMFLENEIVTKLFQQDNGPDDDGRYDAWV